MWRRSTCEEHYQRQTEPHLQLHPVYEEVVHEIVYRNADQNPQKAQRARALFGSINQHTGHSIQ